MTSPHEIRLAVVEWLDERLPVTKAVDESRAPVSVP
jgi:hypothetical protein